MPRDHQEPARRTARSGRGRPAKRTTAGSPAFDTPCAGSSTFPRLRPARPGISPNQYQLMLFVRASPASRRRSPSSPNGCRSSTRAPSASWTDPSAPGLVRRSGTAWTRGACAWPSRGAAPRCWPGSSRRTRPSFAGSLRGPLADAALLSDDLPTPLRRRRRGAAAAAPRGGEPLVRRAHGAAHQHPEMGAARNGGRRLRRRGDAGLSRGPRLVVGVRPDAAPRARAVLRVASIRDGLLRLADSSIRALRQRVTARRPSSRRSISGRARSTGRSRRSSCSRPS